MKRRGRNGKVKRRSEPSRGPKVVFDCNVYLQALIKETGPAAACLTLFENGAIELYVSEALLTELRDVLTRPKLQLRYSRLTEERADLDCQPPPTRQAAQIRSPRFSLFSQSERRTVSESGYCSGRCLPGQPRR